MWKLIKKSNGFLLTGVESIVEHVRINLGKNFTNADLEHHLEMAKKHQVQMNLLMILSYPTETESDYEQVRQWFVEHKVFANSTVLRVQCTLPGILPGTQLEKTIDHNSFQQNRTSRYQNAIDTVKVIQQCGFNVQTFF
jgi:histone acetyltransferase (RNA polymerase elongator complex component)